MMVQYGTWSPMHMFRSMLSYAFGASSNSHEGYITTEQALGYAPIWYGVNKIGGHISQMPVNVHRKEGDGSKVLDAHPVARLLRKPNAYQTSTVFREQVAVQSILNGNGRAAIVRENGQVTELIPLLPEYTATGMVRGIKMHATRPPVDDRVRLFFPTVSGRGVDDDPHGIISLDDSQVVHVPGLTLDGVSGLPLIEAARRNLSISLGSEDRLGTQMNAGFQGSLLLTAPPGVFTDEKDAKEFMDDFKKRHHDPNRAGEPGLLREGITAELIAAKNSDDEFSEQRMFQRQDAALWLGLEQILGDDQSVSYNSLEQKNLAYLQNTLGRWLGRWEEELEAKLLPIGQVRTGSHFVRFDKSSLMKTDFKTAVEALSSALTATIINPNEARKKLDMNPRAGGDEFKNPMLSDIPGAEEGESDDEPSEAEERAMRVVRKRVEALLDVEANRLVAGCKKKDFIGFVTMFYKNWEPKLAECLSDLELDPSRAAVHVQESKSRLIATLERTTPDCRTSAVLDMVKGWRSRSDYLILGAC